MLEDVIFIVSSPSLNTGNNKLTSNVYMSVYSVVSIKMIMGRSLNYPYFLLLSGGGRKISHDET